MKFHQLAVATLAVAMAPVFAAVSPEEAKQLGATLTEFGAIKAGNADGTIPPYTGGLTTPPADFKPNSGFWADPYKNEKPLFRIDAKNLDKYADKLSEGQKRLLKMNPDTYYLDVYPTHRTVAFPDWLIKNTVRNAASCRTGNEGLSLEAGCAGGIPFPIPKNGYEAMWNHMAKYSGDKTYLTKDVKLWVINPGGAPILTAMQSTRVEAPYYQMQMTDRDPGMFSRAYSYTKGPARSAGIMTGIIEFTDPVARARRSWSYMPGLRRVKLAPEFSYDTPVGSMGGVTLYDELFVFSGKMDRFDFKLLGRKEMFLHSNVYKSLDCLPDKAMMPKHPNPACERWELHRAWAVEAKVKAGMRHIYSRRMYYFDEDQTGAALYDAWDQSGALYRTMTSGSFQVYDQKFTLSNRQNIFDFNKGNWAYLQDVSESGYQIGEPLSERDMTPEATVARETSR